MSSKSPRAGLFSGTYEIHRLGIAGVVVAASFTCQELVRDFEKTMIVCSSYKAVTRTLIFVEL